MSINRQKAEPRRRLPFEPYWLVLGPLLLAGAALYGAHLATGATPDNVAVDLFGLSVYWYGVIITGGIALGAWVTARLAEERGRTSLANHVPAAVAQRPLDSLDLPDEVRHILARRRIATWGELLLLYGWSPGNLGLNKAGQTAVEAALRAADDVNPTWLDDAPWRIWSPDHVWNGIIWVLIPAVIGARLYHVLTPSPSMAAIGIESPLDYLRQPFQLINLRNGGLGIYGGIAGGLLGLWLYCRRARIRFLNWSDLAAPGLALGQAIGRWGNFLNQELYGRPTTLPWAVTIDEVHRLPGYERNPTFHPAFLYESLWSLGAFLLLLTLARRHAPRLKTGDLTALYLVAYGVGRTLLELVRLDSRTRVAGRGRPRPAGGHGRVAGPGRNHGRPGDLAPPPGLTPATPAPVAPASAVHASQIGGTGIGTRLIAHFSPRQRAANRPQ